MYSAVARLCVSVARARWRVRARLRQAGFGLGERGARLRELRVDIRRVDLGEELARIHAVTDVDEEPLQIPVGRE